MTDFILFLILIKPFYHLPPLCCCLPLLANKCHQAPITTQTYIFSKDSFFAFLILLSTLQASIVHVMCPAGSMHDSLPDDMRTVQYKLCVTVQYSTHCRLHLRQCLKNKPNSNKINSEINLKQLHFPLQAVYNEWSLPRYTVSIKL